MKRASSGKRTGIQWIFTKQLEDLDLADDISLLSHRHQDAQEVLSRLAEAEKTGLNINTKKTDVIRIKNKKQDPITLHDEDLNEDEKFVYLGSVINKDGGQTKTSRDGSTRPDMYSTPFPHPPPPIWNSSVLSLHNKIGIFNTNVKSVLLYGSETWRRTTKSNTHKLHTFINRCLRNMINIRWLDVISNNDLWDKTGQSPIEVEIRKRKMEVDRPHIQEVPLKSHQASPWLESTRKTKSRKTETDLAQEYWCREEGHRNDMGTAEEDLTEPSALEESCCGPMFLRELKRLRWLKTVSSTFQDLEFDGSL